MLHPQTRALLELIEARQIPPTHTLSVADARAYYRDRRSVMQPAPAEVARVQELQASGPHGGIPLRLYRPLGSAQSDSTSPTQRPPISSIWPLFIRRASYEIIPLWMATNELVLSWESCSWS